MDIISSKKRTAFRKGNSRIIVMCFAWPQLKSADIRCYSAPIDSVLRHSPIKRLTGIGLSNMPCEWGIWSLPSWGGEFEPELSSLSSGAHMFYGRYAMRYMYSDLHCTKYIYSNHTLLRCVHRCFAYFRCFPYFTGLPHWRCFIYLKCFNYYLRCFTCKCSNSLGAAQRLGDVEASKW